MKLSDADIERSATRVAEKIVAAPESVDDSHPGGFGWGPALGRRSYFAELIISIGHGQFPDLLMTPDEPFTPAEAAAVRIIDRLPDDIKARLLEIINHGNA